MKPRMREVLLADLVQPACVHRVTVCFCVLLSLCGTATPLSLYRVCMGRAVTVFSVGIRVGQ